MDLGIKGKTALVCASSKGLGRGCAQALAEEGVDVTIVSRTKQDIERTAAEIASSTGVKVKPLAADITTDAGRKAALELCPDPDILVNNAGGPPPGRMQDWTRDDWIAALDANMITAIELIKGTIDGMVDKGWGRVVNITSSSVKAPIAILGLSNGARSGLTGFVAGIAREYAGKGVTINNLLPGPFDTDRLKGVFVAMSAAQDISIEEAKKLSAANIPVGRLGQADEFGRMCAFLCSQHAGYMTGQNILMDGGQYPGTY
jgi:3-oxoacyl-[acyl-carrier protein] reductase